MPISHLPIPKARVYYFYRAMTNFMDVLFILYYEHILSYTQRHDSNALYAMTLAIQQDDFDPAATLAAIKADRAVRRHRRTWARSQLTRYRAELVSLRNTGASLGDIVHWLAQEKRMTVAKTTVMRYLQKLPELAKVTADA